MHGIIAWRLLLRDRGRFLVAVLGVTLAVSLMTLQGGLLVGFTLAASRVIDSVDADIWIAAKGVRCFEFPGTLWLRYKDRAAGVPGISRVGAISSGFALLQRPDGDRQSVMLVGSDDEFRGRLPSVGRRDHPGRSLVPAFAVDVTDLAVMSPNGPGAYGEFNGHGATATESASGLSSFLGAPFVYTSEFAASSWLGHGTDKRTYIVARTTNTAATDTVRDSLRALFPELDVWTSEEFSWRSRIYWLAQTGAGGALLLSSVLGFLIGTTLVSQVVYATTLENLGNYSTLNAMGAGKRYVARIVFYQAVFTGGLSLAVGFLVTKPALAVVRQMIPWALVPWWMFLVVTLAVFLLCLIASWRAALAAVNADLLAVFRG